MRFKGVVEPYFYDYSLSGGTIIAEAIIFLDRTILAAKIAPLPTVVIFLAPAMLLCGLIPFATLVLLVLSFIFTLLSKGSEKQGNLRKKLMRRVRICVIAEAVLIVAVHIVCTLFVRDLIYPAWGLLVAPVLLIVEAVIQNRLEEAEIDERIRIRSANADSAKDI